MRPTITRATTSMRPTITHATTSTRLMIERGKAMSDQLTSRQPHALRAARSVILRYDTNNDKQISEAEFAQIIQRVQSKLTLLPPQQRIAGKWAKPPADLIEPARTERILAAPFRLLRTHAADCQDAMSMTIITKTNGSGAVIGILFQWFGMCLQVSMAVLAGLGSYLAKGGAPASAQVLTIAGIKLVWAVVLVVCNPCACGLTNAVIAGQCLSEGVASILLWAASVGLIDAAKVRLKMITFMLLLVPVFIPIFQKVYDGLVSLCKLRKKKANKQAALLPTIQFLLMILAKYAGRVANFNPKSLGRTVKQFLADTSQQGVAAGKGQKVKVKRIVRRPKACVEEAGMATAATGMGLGVDQEQPIVSEMTPIIILPLLVPVGLTPAEMPRLTNGDGVVVNNKRRKAEVEDDGDDGDEDGGDEGGD